MESRTIWPNDKHLINASVLRNFDFANDLVKNSKPKKYGDSSLREWSINC